MTEASIQKSIIKYLSSDGWLVFKTVKVTPNGFPDIMAFKDGHTILMEVKTPQGRVSSVQAEQIKRLNNEGIKTFVVKSLTEAKDALKILN